MTDSNDEVLLDIYHPALKLLDTAKALAAAAAVHTKAVEAVRAECGHTVVFRCEYQPSSWRADPPLMQCAHCLLEESEWGSTNELGRPYDKTNGRKYLTISRNALYKRRRLSG